MIWSSTLQRSEVPGPPAEADSAVCTAGEGNRAALGWIECATRGLGDEREVRAGGACFTPVLGPRPGALGGYRRAGNRWPASFDQRPLKFKFASEEVPCRTEFRRRDRRSRTAAFA